MIKGIGIDLIEINRIEKAMAKKNFIQRYFTENEVLFFSEQKNQPSKVAGNFATKEAVVKVFGTGFRKIEMIEIEVLRDDFGKPYVRLTGEAKKQAEALGIQSLHVSISNTKTHVTAVAIGE